MTAPLATIYQLGHILWPDKPPDDPIYDLAATDLADAVAVGTEEVTRFCGRNFTEINPAADPVPATTTWIVDAPVGPLLLIPDCVRIVQVIAYGVRLDAPEWQAVVPVGQPAPTIQQVRRITPGTRAALPWTISHPVESDDPHGQIEIEAFAGWPGGTVPITVIKASLIVAARWYDMQESKFTDLAGNDALGMRRPPNGLLPGVMQQMLTDWIRTGLGQVVEG